MIVLQKGLFKGNGPLTQKFGVNASNYARFGLKGHNGIDYGIPNGTELYSCINGSVTELGDDTNGYGKYIKIENEYCGVIYAHLQKWSVGYGNDIQAGQLIGLSNNTGNSTGPHLHFGVFPKPRNRDNGYAGYIDPLDKKLVKWVDKLDTLPEQPETPEITPTKKLPEEFYKISEFERAKTLYKLTEDDAFDTILEKANNKVTDQDVTIKKQARRIEKRNDEIQDQIETQKELNSQLLTANSAIEDLQKQLDECQKNCEPSAGKEGNATNTDNEAKTDSTNLDNVAITFSTVVYTFLEYVKQTITSKYSK